MDARILDLVSSLALSPASAANTAAATSGNGYWVDTQAFDGDIAVTQSVGAVTGSIAGALQVADDANGTNAVAVSGATFTSVSSANNVQTISVNKGQLNKRYLGYVGTVTTGPALVGVVVSGRKKYV